VIDEIVEAGVDTMVVATRKTHWQLLDKKAVYLGGGGTHRLGLWEAILIKGNHLEGLKREGYVERYIEEALNRVWDQRETVAFIDERGRRRVHRFSFFQGLLVRTRFILSATILSSPSRR